MTPDQLIERARSAPESIEFDDVIAVIEQHYHYSPTRFTTGRGDAALCNEPGRNEGACRIFAFARLHGLDPATTLALFGHYYRDEVLGDPDGSGHRNIRNFIEFGWDGIDFDGVALTPKHLASD